MYKNIMKFKLFTLTWECDSAEMEIYISEDGNLFASELDDIDFLNNPKGQKPYKRNALKSIMRWEVILPDTYVILDEHKKVIGGFQSFDQPVDEVDRIKTMLSEEHTASIVNIYIDTEKREGLDSHYYLCSYTYEEDGAELVENTTVYIHKVIMH